MADRRAGRLARYERRRDFRDTPEPAPSAPRRSSSPPRFVIHEHGARRLHWDLRLEHDGVLACWALPKGMPEQPRENRFAARTEDHPVEYLGFHGEIPAGSYGAGTMSIWDHGVYETLKWEPRKIEVRLAGERLQGRYALFPIDREDPPKDWMIHRMDPPQDPDAEPMPARVAPMLARSAASLPSDDEQWAHEIKWDGVRAIAYHGPGELRLQGRNLNDITDAYPELQRLGRALGSHRAVLDGEIVAFDADGRPSFGALQRRMHVASRESARRLAARTPVTYVIFDLLWLDGHSLMELPYAERRARLLALGLDGERWQTPEHIVGDGERLLAASASQRLEGIVAKRLDSTYQPGRRSGGWLKIKTMGRQEFVVGGWVPGKGRRRESIGALLLGVHDSAGELRYAGRVGTGFSERELQRLARLLAPLRRESSPFAAGERPPRGSAFCEPRLVAEVEFAEWTASGRVRHPSYKGLRDDKDPRAVVREDAPRDAAAREELVIVEGPGGSGTARAGGRELRLSNLGKVMYPQTGFTKRALIEYYAQAAPVLLAHLEGRPLTVTRWPDGVESKSFFQKQSPAHRPAWVRTASVAAGARLIDYTLAGDLATLVWLANLAAVELHTPLARAEAMDRPTAVVFDLDPGAPAGIAECCRVAVRLRGMFEHLGLQSVVKTSGLKGLQVYIPLNDPAASYARTKPFAKAVAELLEREEGELVVSRMTKSRRTGRVLIDWSQNDARKTTVCAYSLRAGPRPTVSTPLAWTEVEAAVAAGEDTLLSFEAAEVLARIEARGDLMAPALSLAQSLPGF